MRCETGVDSLAMGTTSCGVSAPNSNSRPAYQLGRPLPFRVGRVHAYHCSETMVTAMASAAIEKRMVCAVTLAKNARACENCTAARPAVLKATSCTNIAPATSAVATASDIPMENDVATEIPNTTMSMAKTEAKRFMTGTPLIDGVSV